MKRALALVCASVLVLVCMSVAQAPGRLVVSVQKAADPTLPAAPAIGAKVIVVHWGSSGPNPTMVHDRVATTNQMGTCTLELPPDVYDIFVTSSGLAPAAFRREVKAGETASVTANLKPAPFQLRPVQ